MQRFAMKGRFYWKKRGIFATTALEIRDTRRLGQIMCMRVGACKLALTATMRSVK